MVKNTRCLGLLMMLLLAAGMICLVSNLLVMKFDASPAAKATEAVMPAVQDTPNELEQMQQMNANAPANSAAPPVPGAWDANPPAPAQAAAPPAGGALAWSVGVIQDGALVPEQDSAYRLQRKPFTLRIDISQPTLVWLNTSENDANFNHIQPGLLSNDDDQCVHGAKPFCSFMQFVTSTGPGALVINRSDGFSNQGISLTGSDGPDGSRYGVSEQGVIYYEHDVNQIILVNPSLQSSGETNITEQTWSIEQFPGLRLYVMLMAKERSDTNPIQANELHKLILEFANP